MEKEGGNLKNLHVVPHGNGWAVRREGEDRVLETFPTKEKAVAYAREKARQEGVEVVIHGRDEKIQDKDSYGHDPYPPEDTKH